MIVIFNFQFSIFNCYESGMVHSRRLLKGDGTKSVSVPIVKIAVVRDVIVVVYYHGV